jgi:hypothetical protein
MAAIGLEPLSMYALPRYQTGRDALPSDVEVALFEKWGA